VARVNILFISDVVGWPGREGPLRCDAFETRDLRARSALVSCAATSTYGAEKMLCDATPVRRQRVGGRAYAERHDPPSSSPRLLHAET